MPAVAPSTRSAHEQQRQRQHAEHHVVVHEVIAAEERSQKNERRPGPFERRRSAAFPPDHQRRRQRHREPIASRPEWSGHGASGDSALPIRRIPCKSSIQRRRNADQIAAQEDPVSEPGHSFVAPMLPSASQSNHGCRPVNGSVARTSAAAAQDHAGREPPAAHQQRHQQKRDRPHRLECQQSPHQTAAPRPAHQQQGASRAADRHRHNRDFAPDAKARRMARIQKQHRQARPASRRPPWVSRSISQAERMVMQQVEHLQHAISGCGGNRPSGANSSPSIGGYNGPAEVRVRVLLLIRMRKPMLVDNLGIVLLLFGVFAVDRNTPFPTRAIGNGDRRDAGRWPDTNIVQSSHWPLKSMF